MVEIRTGTSVLCSGQALFLSQWLALPRDMVSRVK